MCNSLKVIFGIGGNKIKDTNASEMQESIDAEMKAPLVSLCKMIVVACFSCFTIKNFTFDFPCKICQIVANIKSYQYLYLHWKFIRLEKRWQSLFQLQKAP